MDVAPNVTNYIQCRVNKENLITISLQIQFCVTVSDVRSSQFFSVFYLQYNRRYTEFDVSTYNG